MTLMESLVIFGGLVLGYLIVAKLIINEEPDTITKDNNKIIEPRKSKIK